MKTIAIMQPAYLPWLGYFERAALVDEVISLDHVRIDRNSKTRFANRNRVRTSQGWTWLSVPLRTKGQDDLSLDRLQIDPAVRWRTKHWATLEQNYRRAACFAELAPALEAIYVREWSELVPLCVELTRALLSAFEIDTHFRSSSQMQSRSTKSELILDLCLESQATHYLSGPFGRDYLDREAFARAGITIDFHDYRHPIYPQSYPGFEPNLSACDLLFHAGRDARKILLTRREARAA
ncbi:MAG TPA: WbqC family protein [Planctomycetota bacterium]|nr:WbqC family protein [Planctomycetota bacterium]